MNSSCIVYILQKSLVQCVVALSKNQVKQMLSIVAQRNDIDGYLQAEAYETERWGHRYFKSFIFVDQVVKFTRQFNLATDVRFEAFGAVRAHYEPKFQRTESSSQRNLPVLDVLQKRFHQQRFWNTMKILTL